MVERSYTQREDSGAYVLLIDGGTNPVIRRHRATKYARKDIELEWAGHRVVLTPNETRDLLRRLSRALGKAD